jgi:hypothetical protein
VGKCRVTRLAGYQVSRLPGTDLGYAWYGEKREVEG